jgi:hypothetical protein
METESKSANECARPFLEEALALTDCPKASYHIREALQMLELDELEKN